MKFFISMILFLSLIGLAGCNSSNNKEEKTIFINHFKMECTLQSAQMCMQSRDSEEAQWEHFYEDIAGFDYEWGYTYRLKVEVENINSSEANASSKKYTLLQVLEKTKVSSDVLFELSVNEALTAQAGEAVCTAIGCESPLKKESQGIYRLYEEVKIICTSPECQSLDSLREQGMGILFEFQHD